ncbi:substrate-binding periplasmic protein [Chitinimonas sp.]|uniref:substrate-binding periplasmic protein n=1 Tax=Chitinimonas sp. TaxID=1934313 RepID=UPI002F95370E
MPFAQLAQALFRRLWPLLLCLAAGQAEAADPPLVLGNGEWPPYYGEKLPRQGADSTIVREAFALAGIEVSYRFYPWAQVLAQAQSLHEIVGGVGWADKPEYHADFWISEPTSTHQMVLFQRSDYSWHWHTLEDLRGKRIGLINGYDYPEPLLAMIRAKEVEASWVSGGEICIRMLAAGRIDYYPEDKAVGNLLINKVLGDKRILLNTNGVPISEDSLHLLLGKSLPGSAELMARFNAGLAELKASGRHAAIVEEIREGRFGAP